jgi:hypothetical protein
MTEPEADSLITGLATAARSRKGRTLLAAAWPWLLAAATFGGGLVVEAQQLEPRVVGMAADIKAMAADLKGLRASVVASQTTDQHNIIRIGRQAAYATAEAESYESPGVKAKKQAWAEKYAAAYERMVAREGVTPEVAYTALGMQVAVPQ